LHLVGCRLVKNDPRRQTVRPSRWPGRGVRLLVGLRLVRMTMKRIYIAGPMTGLPDLNFPAFHAEAARLRSRGVDVVNPAEINGGADEVSACAGMTPDELQAHWRKCMRNDIAQLV